MGVAEAAVSLILAGLITLTGLAKVTAHPSMQRNATHLGYSLRSFRVIGVIELAAAAALVVGMWWSPLAIAAAAGLVLLMVGAVVAHSRAGDSPAAGLPALLCAGLAMASGVLGVMR
jgi:uncharacterized membrane protein YphA (DoxX/SURF4 family)